MHSITTDNVKYVAVENAWNFGDEAELTMHTIHAYPAKFPAFIAKKAFDYAESEGVNVRKVADVFCGCGTVALEAKTHKKDFWGCDINPVATLIARAKSATYDECVVKELFERIYSSYHNLRIHKDAYQKANERLKYWFTENSYIELLRLQTAIENNIDDEKYLEAFQCLFSSILKAASRWLTKSIKPQVDPNKGEINIWEAFVLQYNKFIRAIEQLHMPNNGQQVEIVTRNFLEANDLPMVDLIITSPPYVTSYEYADLHQLSSLWLRYTEDYRTLRCGTIGSSYNSNADIISFEQLNTTGKRIVSELVETKNAKAHVRSVARYYVDIQNAIVKCSGMLNNGGMAFFVVGDTEYKGTRIKNSEHLVESLLDSGFSDIKAAKRLISKKILTPYRDEFGRFTSDKSKRTVYHEEYVISGRIMKQ